MGLGPPVCTECRVFAVLRDTPVLRNSWMCPSCNNLAIGHLWELPEEQWQLYHDNTKLLNFVKGK